MLIEVHIHGIVRLRPGINLHDLDSAFQPFLEYLGVESINNVTSLYHDESGISFDSKNQLLDICWSGEVENSFPTKIEFSFTRLNTFSDSASEIEVSYYDEEDNEEISVIFVGPSLASIHEIQRLRMTEEVAKLISRHFDDSATQEVVDLVNDLFARDWTKRENKIANNVFDNNLLIPLSGRRVLH